MACTPAPLQASTRACEASQEFACVKTTWHPSAAKCRTIDWPMPRLPPVTTATRPANPFVSLIARLFAFPAVAHGDLGTGHHLHGDSHRRFGDHGIRNLLQQDTLDFHRVSWHH